MTDDQPRRSRTAWPGPMSVAGVQPGHVHDLPASLRARYRLLLVAVVALLLAVGTLTFFVYQQQQYVEGRGEYRDREAARIKQENTERLRRGICDLLDTFPEGVDALERARKKYECGPGIPRELLTPEEQARIQPPQSGVPATPADTGPPSLLGGAVQTTPPTQAGPPPRPEGAPPRSTTPEASPEPVDLGPVTDLICTVPLLCD